MGLDVRRFAYFGAVSLLLACSTSCGHSTVSANISLGNISVIRSPDEVKRQIEYWLPTDAQVDAIKNAADAATRMCIAGFGIQLPKNLTQPSSTGSQYFREQSPEYGYFAPESVQQKGYDRIVVVSPTSATSSPITDMLLSGRDASAAVVTEYAGKKVPPGGCINVGIRATGGAPPDAASTQGLPAGGPKIPQNEPHLVSVYASWSACMKTKGLTYATPMDAYLNPKWVVDNGPSKHSSDEIGTAQADMECKESTNLVGVAVAVENAYDTNYITSHHADLLKAKRDLDLRVNNADALISAAKNP